MALKGTTVIELTNVKTGEVERYEEHNLITQALAHLHSPIGNLKLPTDGLTYDRHNNNRQSETYEPLYPKLLGGIVLWDKQMEEKDTIITPPNGVRMVGCAACGSTNGTTSPCRGNYNGTESYFTNSSVETSMKFVYDFATSQANGNINCVSLTSYAGGKNGFGGNDSGVDFCGSNGIYSNNLLYGIERAYRFYSSNQSRVVYIDPDNDCFYEVTGLSTTTLTLRKYKANIHSRSAFTNIYTSHKLLETFSLTLPTTLSGTNTWCLNYDADHDTLYVVVSPSSSTVATSGTFYVIEVNMTTLAVSVHTLTNKIGSTFRVGYNYLTCHGGYIYYLYDSYYIRKISMTDSSYTSIHNGTGKIYNYSYPRVLAGALYYYCGYTSDTSTYQMVGRLDFSETRGRGIGFTECASSYYLVPFKGYPFHYYYSYSSTSNGITYYYGYLYTLPLYIATINNLSRTIEKTSDKTMKITYTIQEM